MFFFKFINRLGKSLKKTSLIKESIKKFFSEIKALAFDVYRFHGGFKEETTYRAKLFGDPTIFFRKRERNTKALFMSLEFLDKVKGGSPVTNFLFKESFIFSPFDLGFNMPEGRGKELVNKVRDKEASFLINAFFNLESFFYWLLVYRFVFLIRVLSLKGKISLEDSFLLILDGIKQGKKKRKDSIFFSNISKEFLQDIKKRVFSSDVETDEFEGYKTELFFDFWEDELPRPASFFPGLGTIQTMESCWKELHREASFLPLKLVNKKGEELSVCLDDFITFEESFQTSSDLFLFCLKPFLDLGFSVLLDKDRAFSYSLGPRVKKQLRKRNYLVLRYLKSSKKALLGYGFFGFKIAGTRSLRRELLGKAGSLFRPLKKPEEQDLLAVKVSPGKELYTKKSCKWPVNPMTGKSVAKPLGGLQETSYPQGYGGWRALFFFLYLFNAKKLIGYFLSRKPYIPSSSVFRIFKFLSLLLDCVVGFFSFFCIRLALPVIFCIDIIIFFFRVFLFFIRDLFWLFLPYLDLIFRAGFGFTGKERVPSFKQFGELESRMARDFILSKNPGLKEEYFNKEAEDHFIILELVDKKVSELLSAERGEPVAYRQKPRPKVDHVLSSWIEVTGKEPTFVEFFFINLYAFVRVPVFYVLSSLKPIFSGFVQLLFLCYRALFKSVRRVWLKLITVVSFCVAKIKAALSEVSNVLTLRVFVYNPKKKRFNFSIPKVNTENKYINFLYDNFFVRLHYGFAMSGIYLSFFFEDLGAILRICLKGLTYTFVLITEFIIIFFVRLFGFFWRSVAIVFGVFFILLPWKFFLYIQSLYVRLMFFVHEDPEIYWTLKFFLRFMVFWFIFGTFAPKAIEAFFTYRTLIEYVPGELAIPPHGKLYFGLEFSRDFTPGISPNFTQWKGFDHLPGDAPPGTYFPFRWKTTVFDFLQARWDYNKMWWTYDHDNANPHFTRYPVYHLETYHLYSKSPGVVLDLANHRVFCYGDSNRAYIFHLFVACFFLFFVFTMFRSLREVLFSEPVSRNVEHSQRLYTAAELELYTNEITPASYQERLIRPEPVEMRFTKQDILEMLELETEGEDLQEARMDTKESFLNYQNVKYEYAYNQQGQTEDAFDLEFDFYDEEFMTKFYQPQQIEPEDIYFLDYVSHYPLLTHPFYTEQPYNYFDTEDYFAIRETLFEGLLGDTGHDTTGKVYFHTQHNAVLLNHFNTQGKDTVLYKYKHKHDFVFNKTDAGYVPLSFHEPFGLRDTEDEPFWVLAVVCFGMSAGVYLSQMHLCKTPLEMISNTPFFLDLIGREPRDFWYSRWSSLVHHRADFEELFSDPYYAGSMYPRESTNIRINHVFFHRGWQTLPIMPLDSGVLGWYRPFYVLFPPCDEEDVNTMQKWFWTVGRYDLWFLFGDYMPYRKFDEESWRTMVTPELQYDIYRHFNMFDSLYNGGCSGDYETDSIIRKYYKKRWRGYMHPTRSRQMSIFWVYKFPSKPYGHWTVDFRRSLSCIGGYHTYKLKRFGWWSLMSFFETENTDFNRYCQSWISPTTAMQYDLVVKAERFTYYQLDYSYGFFSNLCEGLLGFRKELQSEFYPEENFYFFNFGDRYIGSRVFQFHARPRIYWHGGLSRMVRPFSCILGDYPSPQIWDHEDPVMGFGKVGNIPPANKFFKTLAAYGFEDGGTLYKDLYYKDGIWFRGSDADALKFANNGYWVTPTGDAEYQVYLEGYLEWYPYPDDWFGRLIIFLNEKFVYKGRGHLVWIKGLGYFLSPWPVK